MTVLSKVARKYYSTLQTEYLDKLGDETGIEDVYSYLEKVGAIDEASKPEVEKAIIDNEIQLECLFRVAPTNGNQKIMLATINPGIGDIRPSKFEGNREYARHNRAGSDVEKTALTVAQNLHGTLKEPRNELKFIIQELREGLDWLEKDLNYNEYVNIRNENEVFQKLYRDFHYTWVFKLPSRKAKHINRVSPPSRFDAQNQFTKEIFQVVQPRIIVSIGKDAWMSILGYVKQKPGPISDHIKIYSNHSSITDSYWTGHNEPAYGGLYYLTEEDLWIITVFHHSMWVKADKFKQNVDVLNEHI